MTSWLDEDVRHMVRLAWELGVVAGHADNGRNCEVMGNAIAKQVQANVWIWQSGVLDISNNVPIVRWSRRLSSPEAPLRCTKGYDDLFRQLGQKSVVEQSTAWMVLANTWDMNAHPKSGWHSLTCLRANASLEAQCLEFFKPCDLPPFSELEQAFVKAALASLPDNRPEEIPTQTAQPSKHGLPKRQREVLELLLLGSSVKEIGFELGISPHTVNDYAKSLYRHYSVSGRAELAAIFLKSGRLELTA